MMKKQFNQTSDYQINFDALEEDGSFQCPKCGKSISPDDDKVEDYQILETKVGLNGELAELLIICGKCRSTIKLIGLQQGLDA